MDYEQAKKLKKGDVVYEGPCQARVVKIDDKPKEKVVSITYPVL